MELILTEDQELIAKTASDFVTERSPVSRVRTLRDSADPVGFSRELWKEMAELGWVGIPFPEAYGGADLGLAELVVVLEALGRSLAPEPFLSTVLLGGQALLRSGNEALCRAWLPGLVAGETILGAALQGPRSRYELFVTGATAEARGDQVVLRGEKTQVLEGHVADALLVSARSSGREGEREGVSLFLVPRDAAGLGVVRQSRVDQRPVAQVRLDGVAVAREASLGPLGEAGSRLEEVVDRATVGLCAEMLGGMQEAFDLTLGHLKSREQFGQPIGSFQALKHRAADVFIAIELCRSTVMAAARAVDAGDPEAPRLVSLAKASCSEAYVHATNEAVQLFGGVGMTDEYDIGFYMKRARAAAQSFGDAAHHRARWAALGGY